jgi:hypothetical protein
MISVKELDFVKAHEQFQRMCEFLERALSEGHRVDQVERGLFPQAMTMCLELLRSFVEAHGDGDRGKTLQREGKILDRLPKPHEKRYLSIFGELLIDRWVYGTREGQAIEWLPLDAALGLPVGENSYVLEDWLQRLCIQEAFGESVDSLRAWLGTTVSVRTAERMSREMSEYMDGFRGEAIPPAAEEEELLVVTADGKGVPMRRTLAARLQAESQACEGEGDGNAQLAGTTGGTMAIGEEETHSSPPVKRLAGQGKNGMDRPGKKQMSYVGAIYTQARFPRTAEDVIDEVRRRKRAKDRPEPQHKHVWARMTQFLEGEPLPAAPMLFLEMMMECYRRDPMHKKPCICVMDGERQLWNLAEEWFPGAIGILDLFHAMKRLWDVAHCLYAEESAEAGEFVTHNLRMLLQGKVGYVLRAFRPLVKAYNLKGTKRTTVEAAITYYENNQEHMRYDKYLAAGYPIASGVAEGACKHLVKDRMERAGMRWELEGAQAILSLRAIYLNGLWDQFIAYRVATEQTRLYGEDTQHATAA